MDSTTRSQYQRYVDLYQKFADSWRVTNSSSLFDYAPGTSTPTFTVASWPLEQPLCVLPDTTPVQPATLAVAQRACRAVVGRNRKANCVIDVQVTGEIGFAKTYLLSQKIETGATQVVVIDDKDPTKPEELVVFTASVARVQGKGVPTGTVQFIVDGKQVGAAVKLDARGQARWRTKDLRPGTHQCPHNTCRTRAGRTWQAPVSTNPMSLETNKHPLPISQAKPIRASRAMARAVQNH